MRRRSQGGQRRESASARRTVGVGAEQGEPERGRAGRERRPPRARGAGAGPRRGRRARRPRRAAIRRRRPGRAPASPSRARASEGDGARRAEERAPPPPAAPARRAGRPPRPARRRPGIRASSPLVYTDPRAPSWARAAMASRSRPSRTSPERRADGAPPRWAAASSSARAAGSPARRSRAAGITASILRRRARIAFVQRRAAARIAFVPAGRMPPAPGRPSPRRWSSGRWSLRVNGAGSRRARASPVPVARCGGAAARRGRPPPGQVRGRLAEGAACRDAGETMKRAARAGSTSRGLAAERGRLADSTPGRDRGRYRPLPPRGAEVSRGSGADRIRGEPGRAELAGRRAADTMRPVPGEETA